MRIVSSYSGSQRNWETSEREITFGRPGEKSARVLDLSPDQKVSRVHGRIWRENGNYWIEDLNSGRGTLLNSVEIKGQGKKKIEAGDVIVAGDTTIHVDSLDRPAPVAGETNFLEAGTNLPREERPVQTGVDIVHELDASVFDPLGTERIERSELSALANKLKKIPKLPEQLETVKATVSSVSGSAPVASDLAESRLKLVCELPMLFAEKTQLALLLPTIVDRTVEMIPDAQSWALLLREERTDTLLLKAYRSIQQPLLSETLARRAVSKRNAFVWKRDFEKDEAGTLFGDPSVIGMYAPMLWQDQVIGVICATAWDPDTTFTEEDLRMLVVVAQYGAMAVASHQLQEKLRQESVVRSNLLRQFSPQVADRLLAHRGRLRLGGEKSEVTILSADIRGFTRLTKDMDADDVVELLNDYFSVLVPVIFAHEGTVDKYMGDAILSIFGSPDPDPKHHEHSVLAAIEMQAAVAKLNEKRRLRGAPCCGIGIGMHCGEVVHGLVGTQNRMEFTVIGDVVNRATRYCEGAASTEILISPEMHERLWRIAETEQTAIHTKHEGDFIAYRVNRLKSGASPE